jgi:uncharacterized membrane protein
LLLPIPAALWLIFFPNAPYIVTDFLHLYDRPPSYLYDIGMLATFAWTGCFLAIASLRTMQYLVKYFLGGFGQLALCRGDAGDEWVGHLFGPLRALE